MAQRDLVHNLSMQQVLAPAARTATANGAGIATADFNAIAFLFEFGTVTDGTHTPSLQDSPDNSTWTAVPASGLLDSQLAAVTSGAGNGSSTVQKVGYIGGQPYVRGIITVSGATTGAVDSCVAILGQAAHLPQ